MAVTNQLCWVNLLYPRSTGAAFMYKLRPLGINPIVHTGLHYSRRCSDTACLPCVSPFFPLRLSGGRQQSLRQTRGAVAACTDGGRALMYGRDSCMYSSRSGGRQRRGRRQSSLPLATGHPASDPLTQHREASLQVGGGGGRSLKGQKKQDWRCFSQRLSITVHPEATRIQ